MLIGLLIIAFVLQGPGMAMMIWMPWHISLGFALLGVAGLRLLSRAIDRRRPSVAGWVARITQAALYFVLIAVVLTGWLAYRPTPLIPPPKLFGYLPIPIIHFPLPLPWIGWHQALVWLLVGLVVLHAAAATYHLIVLKDRVFSGMLFGRDSSD